MSKDTIVSVDDFCAVLADTYRKFADEEVKKKVKSGIRKIAREAKTEVIAKSPKNTRKKKYDEEVAKRYKEITGEDLDITKRYAESWVTSTKEENGIYTVAVHNKKWQLVHLLELGHVLRDGTGRVYGDVPAYEHVESTQKHAEEKVDKLLEEL